MNEFDLQGWERELQAWRRRLERNPPGALRSALHATAVEIGALRGHVFDDERRIHERVARRFSELRALYDRGAGGGSSTTTPA